MSHASRLIAVSLASAALSLAPSAHAWTWGGMISVAAPCPSARTALEVAHEAVDLDCTDTDVANVRCVYRATYTLRNPTDETVHASVSVPESHGSLSIANGASTQSIELVVPPRAVVELVMRGARHADIERSDRVFHGFGEGALGIMHPLLVEPRDRTLRVLLSWQRANHCDAQSSWASVREATVATHVPASWHPTIGWEQMALCRFTRGSVDCLQADETEQSNVSMSVERSLAGPIRNGGITLGLGATTPHGLRARLGYDVGIGRRFMGSASVEADVAGNVVLTPAVGYAFTLWPVSWWRDAGFPAALVTWVGAPVGVWPDRRAGVRGQVSLMWIFAGIDTAVDYWPVDGRVDVSVMLRVGI